MAELTVEGSRLVRRFDGETLWIEAWGENSLRVRATRRAKMDDADWALLPPNRREASIAIAGGAATITNGELTARVNEEGWLSFVDQRGRILLEEYWRDRHDRTRFTSPPQSGGPRASAHPRHRKLPHYPALRGERRRKAVRPGPVPGSAPRQEGLAARACAQERPGQRALRDLQSRLRLSLEQPGGRAA